MDEAKDKVQLTTFKASLKSKDFVVALAKSPPESMAKMSQKYMNTEDALATIEHEGSSRKNIRDEPKS